MYIICMSGSRLDCGHSHIVILVVVVEDFQVHL
jgi:hypothetical protein